MDGGDVLDGRRPRHYFIIIGHWERTNLIRAVALGTIIINDRSNVLGKGYLTNALRGDQEK